MRNFAYLPKISNYLSGVQRLLKFIRSNSVFIIPYAFLAVFLIPVFILVSKNSLHLLINRYNLPLADFSFKYLTFLGDGFTPFVIAFIFLFFSFRKTIEVATAGSLAGLIGQFLKRIVFPGIKRPYAIFKDLPDFHLVQGVDMHSSFSFPSGHAATIFAACFILAGFTSNKPLKFILFLVALLVGFSRVYLSQHFLIDMYAGSFIGILSALAIFIIFDRLQAEWLDSSLLKVLKINR